MMNRYLLVIATALVMGIGDAHAAADWRVISQGGGLELKIDYSRPFGTGTIRKVWTQNNFAEPQKQVPIVTTGPFRSVVELNYVNCQNRTSAVVFAVFYAKSNMQGGTVASTGSTEEPPDFSFRETVPGSIGEDIVDLVCAGYSPPKSPAGSASVEPKNAPRDIDWSVASAEEREQIESVCSLDRQAMGPAAYYACRDRQLQQLAKAPRDIDWSIATADERKQIESVCSLDRKAMGPAAYYQCVARQLRALNAHQ